MEGSCQSNIFTQRIFPGVMNTNISTNTCNGICEHCRSTCDFQHDLRNNSTDVRHYHHLCRRCVCKSLPFNKVNKNELHFMFKETFREVINKFQNMHFDETDTNDNIECCQYLELEEVKNIAKCDTNRTNFSLIYVNIVSLDANIDKIRTLLYGMDSNPDIIGVSETRINDSNVARCDCELRGYHFVYDNSPSNGKPGGAGLFIKNGVDYKIRNDLKIMSGDCENIWIETTINGKKGVLASLYRHPRHNFTLFQNELTNKLAKLDKENLIYYLGGDVNINLIKTSTNNAIKFYFDDVTSAGTQVLINKPTRITADSVSLVDHIYCNDPLNNLTPGIVIADMSDHLPLYLKVTAPSVSSNSQTNRLIRDWKNFKINDFRKELREKLNLSLGNSQNLDGNSKFNRFNTIFNATVDKYLPLRPCTKKEERRRENPWMTNALFKSIKTKNKLYFIKRKHRLTVNINKYKKHRNLLNRLIKIAKKVYYKSKLEMSANKSKAIWSVINELLGKKKKANKI